MKTALVTTTIHVPEVLRLYRACSPSQNTRFFVAGDLKTPKEASILCDDIPNCAFIRANEHESKWACSDFIGWNTVERRNIATLEALKWGAEIIVSVDDDNIPMSTDYFDRYEMVLGASFSGLSGTTIDNWFDPGCLIHPHTRHRGFPVEITATPYFYGPVVDAKVGVAAGLILGDPDISAVDRISQKPIVQNVSQLAHNGVVVLPGTKTVFNSQNIAFLRELAPCFLLCPQFGRFADIWASLIMQKIMRERALHVHFGLPAVWQTRNAHNLLDDLDAEVFGMRHTLEFAELLDNIPLAGKSVVDDVRTVWGVIRQPTWMPDGVSALASAWLEDCERVL